MLSLYAVLDKKEWTSIPSYEARKHEISQETKGWAYWLRKKPISIPWGPQMNKLRTTKKGLFGQSCGAGQALALLVTLRQQKSS